MDVSTLKGITQDSRRVKRGYLFAAFPGSKSDGREFIATAIEHGASVILAPEGAALPNGVNGVELITDPNPRKIFAHLAAEFYGVQPDQVVAVTGTNGKTSVVTFVEQLWVAAGYKASSIGTLKGAMTTPDAAALHAQIVDLNAAGVTHLAMEASSHGLDQHRLDGVKLQVAGFTNLTHDHLDYHGDMDTYFDAKARLFLEILSPEGTAVMNADTPESSKLNALCKQRGVKVLSYGYQGEDLKLLSVTPAAHGQKIQLEISGAPHEITLPLVGEFQVMNVLCALGMVLAQDYAHQDVYVAALENLNGAPGRLQYVGGHSKKAAIYVDYAHTPDALTHVLKALRPHTDGRLVCLLGCGGDRDKAKRPIMGKIAAENADIVIVTDDNPRGESPEGIRNQILAAAPNAQNIGDRGEAIKTAIQNLSEGDVLVIAGKGHEQGQLFADRTDPFDDVDEAQKAIESLMHNTNQGSEGS